MKSHDSMCLSTTPTSVLYFSEPIISDHEEIVLLLPDADVTQKSLPWAARKAPEVEATANELALFLGQPLRFLPGKRMRTFRDEGEEPSQKGNRFLFKHLFSFTFSTEHKSFALNPHLLVIGLFLSSESHISGQPDLLTH